MHSSEFFFEECENGLPLVSIIIPVYNRASMIAECLLSALNQTYGNVEIIICDNHSDDGTWRVCEEFASQYRNILIFQHEENIGPVRNWMFGVEKARGKYLKLLFSDDLLEPECVAEMVKAFEENLNVGFVYSSVFYGVSRANAKIAYEKYTSRIENITLQSFVYQLTLNKTPLSPCSALLKTTDVKKNLFCNIPSTLQHEYENHGAGPDILLMLKSALPFKTIIYLRSPLVFFRVHEGSLSVANKNNSINKAYASALCFFVSEYMKDRRLWAKIAGYFLFLGKRRLYFNLSFVRDFCLEHNGTGEKIDVLRVWSASIKTFFREMSRKILDKL